MTPSRTLPVHRARRRAVPVAFLCAATTVAMTALPAVAAPAAPTEPAAPGGTAQAEPVVINLLNITDFHGRLQASGSTAGAAVIGGAVEQYRSVNPDTVFVGSGDMIGGSTFVSASQQDKPTLDVLNLMGVSAMALGNHELDQGQDDFSDRVVPAANFPYLAANVTGLDGVRPYTVWTAPESGVRVGFIGVITQKLPTLVSPDRIPDVQVTDKTQAVLTYADQLTDGDESNDEADILVVLAHDGPSTTDVSGVTTGDYGQFVDALRAHGQIDAVLGGHSHIPYAHDLDGFWATQAGGNSQYMTIMEFTYDPATDQVSTLAETLPLAPGGEPAFPADPDVQKVVDDAADAAAVIGAQPVGRIATDILRGNGESPLSNLIADVQLGATTELGADLALMNPGGVRDDLRFGEDGVVTYEDVAVVQPFANTLVTVPMTGAQLKAVLEQQWRENAFIRLGASGTLTYTFDDSRPVGSKIVDLRVHGEPVQPTEDYLVTTNSFLASGGDGFSAFTQAGTPADSGRIDLAALVDYFNATDVVEAPADQRAMGVSVSGQAEPGRTLTVDVSSFLFGSSPQLGGTTVQVMIGEALVGEATLDATVDGDATGKATVEITVPVDVAAGVHTLTVTDGVSTAYAPLSVVAEEDPVVPAGLSWFLSDALNVHPFEAGAPVFYGLLEADEVFVGDWDGDGVDTPAYRVGNSLHLRNSLTSGEEDVVYTFGRDTDVFLVGDWDGDGVDTFAVRRGNQVLLDIDGRGGAAEQSFTYGRADDLPLAGDFDGDGTDSVAVRRGATTLIRNALSTGNAHQAVTFGRAQDGMLVGDWNGDGTDTLAVVRGEQFLARNVLLDGPADLEVPINGEWAALVAGTFTEGAADTLGMITLNLED